MRVGVGVRASDRVVTDAPSCIEALRPPARAAALRTSPPAASLRSLCGGAEPEADEIGISADEIGISAGEIGISAELEAEVATAASTICAAAAAVSDAHLRPSRDHAEIMASSRGGRGEIARRSWRDRAPIMAGSRGRSWRDCARESHAEERPKRSALLDLRSWRDEAR